MADFADLSRGAQLARMRAAALDVLARHDLAVRQLRLLDHGFNTTFRVDAADGRRFALRINVNSRRGPEHVRGEVAWVAALGRDTTLHLPRPAVARDGEAVQLVSVEGLLEPRPAVLYSWLPGRLLDRALNPSTVAQLGELAATLHAHAAGWRLPPDAALLEGRRVFYDYPVRLWDESHPLLTDSLRALFRSAWERAQAALDRAWAAAPPRPIHHDLHPWNFKWLRGRLMVFDFDDALWGHPIQDLAIAGYYLRRAPAWTPDWDEAFRAGYARRGGAWPEDEQGREDLLAGRDVYLANYLFLTTNAEVRAKTSWFLERARGRLRAWRETGRMG